MAIGNPWIFSHVRARMRGETAPEVGPDQRFDIMRRYLQESVKYFGEEIACRMMRSRLCWFAKGLRNSSQFRKSINHISTQTGALQRIDAYQESFDFFSDPIKQKLSLAIIEWLNTIDPINSSHEFALRMAVLYWADLSITHRDNLINAIFDKLIAKTNVVDEINMGFEIIYQLTPKVRYNSYRPHFEILMTRLEAEQNPDLKKAILVGLEKVKTKPTKLSKPFWDKIKKMLGELSK